MIGQEHLNNGNRHCCQNTKSTDAEGQKLKAIVTN